MEQQRLLDGLLHQLSVILLFVASTLVDQQVKEVDDAHCKANLVYLDVVLFHKILDLLLDDISGDILLLRCLIRLSCLLIHARSHIEWIHHWSSLAIWSTLTLCISATIVGYVLLGLSWVGLVTHHLHHVLVTLHVITLWHVVDVWVEPSSLSIVGDILEHIVALDLILQRAKMLEYRRAKDWIELGV